MPGAGEAGVGGVCVVLAVHWVHVRYQMNGNGRPNIVIEVGSEGDISAYAISHLEDLWHDYLYLRKRAEEAFHQSSSPFLHRRYLRVATLLLQAYLEGVVNRFCVDILQEENKSRKEQKSFLYCNKIDKKCEFVWSKAFREEGSALFDNPRAKAFKGFRNRLAHLRDDGDFELFTNLSLTLLNDAESDIVSWLNALADAFAKSLHPDTESTLTWLESLGDTVDKSYSGDLEDV